MPSSLPEHLIHQLAVGDAALPMDMLTGGPVVLDVKAVDAAGETHRVFRNQTPHSNDRRTDQPQRDAALL